MRRLRVRRSCVHSYLPGLLRPGGVVVDAGANRGDFSRHISAQYECSIHAIEPVQEFHSVLRRIPRVTLHADCLSPETGQAPLYRLEGRDATLYPAAPNDSSYQIDIVNGVALEVFLERENLLEVDLLKMDIEGAELAVLETTSSDVLQRMRQITVEFHDWMYPETEENVEALKGLLTSYGFYCIKFSGNNGDVLFVRRDMVSYSEYLYLAHIVRNIMGVSRIIRRYF